MNPETSLFGKIISKLLLGILIVMMIAGVALWGINDIMISSKDKTVAKVGNRVITETELDNRVNNSKMQLMQSGMNNISEEFRGVLRNNAMVNLIGDRLLQNEFADQNLMLDSKEILKKDYLSQPDFNKDVLKNIIDSQGGEKYFLNKITQEKKIDILQASLTSVLPINDDIIKNAYNSENQTRDIAYIELDANSMANAKEPTQEEIAEFYKKNEEQFVTPEYRAVSFVIITSENIKNTDGQDASDKLTALSNEIQDKIAGGATLEEIAGQYGLDIKKINSVDARGISSSGEKVMGFPKVNNFVAAIFATDADQVSDMLESADGNILSLVRVDGITEKHVKDLSEVKELAIAGWKAEQRAVMLVDTSKKLKDDLDSGKTTFEKFASQNNITIKTRMALAGKSPEFMPEFTADVANLNKSAYSNIHKSMNGKLIIAKVMDVHSAKPADELTMFKYGSTIREQVSQEIMAQYLDYLKQKYNVKIYTK